jgi:protein mago nashi
MILSEQVLLEFKRIVEESKVMELDDEKWPEPDSNGLQELELIIGNVHVCFVTSKIGSLLEVEKSKDPEGFEAFYYLVQDLKCFVLALISTHFKVKPI